MIYVLIAAGALTLLMGQIMDTVVIAAVVVINALVGFIQEGRAANALESIRDMLAPETTVRRDGRPTTVEATELVPGDVVQLSAGDKVPADLRLIEASNLSIGESALTGESVAAEKDTDDVPAFASIGDPAPWRSPARPSPPAPAPGSCARPAWTRKSARLPGYSATSRTSPPPLTRAMGTFSSLLAVVAVALAVVMVLVARLAYGTGFDELLLAAVGFAVAAIPEGLPAVMAITLAIGVQRMAGENAITRRMNSVETLGAVTTICTDKTGTLTRNEMMVRPVVTAAHTYEVTGGGYDTDGEVLLDDRPADPGDHRDLALITQGGRTWPTTPTSATARSSASPPTGPSRLSPVKPVPTSRPPGSARCPSIRSTSTRRASISSPTAPPASTSKAPPTGCSRGAPTS